MRRQVLQRFRRTWAQVVQGIAFFAMLFQPVPLMNADGSSPLLDTDGDGMPDAWETQYGLSPNDATDAFKDNDGDRVPNLWEYLRGTDPTNAASAPTPDAVVDASGAMAGSYPTLQAAYDALPQYLADGVTPYHGYIEVRPGVYTAGVDGTAVPKKVLWLADTGGQVIIQSSGPAMVIAEDAVVDGFTILGYGQAAGPGIVVQPSAGATNAPLVRVVNTIIAGRDGSSDSTYNSAGGVINNGGDLWLVQDTLVENHGAGSDALYDAGGTTQIVNSIIGWQAPGSTNAPVSHQGSGLTVQSTIITGMQGAWSSWDVDPMLSIYGGHLTALSGAALGSGTGGAGDVVDIYGQVRPTPGRSGPDLGAEQWVDSVGNGVPDWYAQRMVSAGQAGSIAQVQPGTDYSGDGRSVLQEFQLGALVPGGAPLAAPPSGRYVLSLSADQTTLPQGSEVNFYAQLQDTQHGTPLAGVPLTFSVASGDGTVNGGQTVTAVTDGGGNAVVSFTGGYSPSQVNVADGGGYGSSASGGIAVTSAPDTYTLSLSSDQSSVYPGQTANLSGQLWDNTQGQGAAYATVNFSVVSGDGTVTYATSTDGSGNFSAVIFTGGYSSSQINAWDGNNFGSSASCSVGVNYTNTGPTDPGTPMPDSYAMSISADKTMLMPGQQATVTVQVMDTTTSQPVSGAFVSFGIQSGNGYLGIVSGSTDGDGYLSVPFTAGQSATQITASEGSYGTNNSLTIGVFSGSGDRFQISLQPEQNPLASGQQTTLNVQVMDLTAGLPVSGATINFNIDSGDGGVNASSLITDENGAGTVTFTAGNSATQVDAFDGNGLGAAGSCTMSLPSADSFGFNLGADQSTLYAGQQATLFAQFVDQTTGQPVSGAGINFAVTSGDGFVSAGASSTDGNGNCAVTFTAGSYNSVVSVWDSGGYAAQMFGFTVISSGSGSQDNYSIIGWADRNPLRPGQATTLYAQFMDQSSGQPMANATVNFNVVGDGGDGLVNGGGSTGAITDGNGVATVTYTGGSNTTTVTAADSGGLSSPATVPVGVNTDTYVLYLNPGQSALSPGGSTTLTAQLVDSSTGNTPVTNAVIALDIESGGDGSFSGSVNNYATSTSYTDTTDASGTIYLNFIGGNNETVVDAADDSGTGATQSTIFYVSGSGSTCSGGTTSGSCTTTTTGTTGQADTYSLTMAAGQTTLATGGQTVVAAVLSDVTQSYAAVSGATVTFSVSSSGDGTLNKYQAVTDDTGTAKVIFTGGTLVSVLTATDDYGDSTPGTTFQVAAADQYQLTLTPVFGPLSQGDSTDVSVLLMDKTTQSPVAGVEVNYKVSADGALDNTSGVTLSDGTCLVTFTMGVNTAVVTASAGGYGSGNYTFSGMNVVETGSGGTCTGTGSTCTGNGGTCGGSTAGGGSATGGGGTTGGGGGTAGAGGSGLTFAVPVVVPGVVMHSRMRTAGDSNPYGMTAATEAQPKLDPKDLSGQSTDRSTAEADYQQALTGGAQPVQPPTAMGPWHATWAYQEPDQDPVSISQTYAGSLTPGDAETAFDDYLSGQTIPCDAVITDIEGPLMDGNPPVWQWKAHDSGHDAVTASPGGSTSTYGTTAWDGTSTTVLASDVMNEYIKNDEDGPASLAQAIMDKPTLSADDRESGTPVPGTGANVYSPGSAMGGWTTVGNTSHFPSGQNVQLWFERVDQSDLARQQDVTLNFLKIHAQSSIDYYSGDVTWDYTSTPPVLCTVTIQAGHNVTSLGTGDANPDGTISLQAAPEGEYDPDYAVQEYLVPVEIVPDYNRDGTIDASDKGRISLSNPWRWWINDDSDSGDTATDGSDTPGNTTNPNYANHQVDGTCDLLDFFPVHLEIAGLLKTFPPDTAQYILSSGSGAQAVVNFVDTKATKDLIAGSPGVYLTDKATVDSLKAAATHPADGSTGAALSADFLNALASDPTKGILLLEGAGKTQGATTVNLEVWQEGGKLATVPLYLSISGVENMYRWINLRGIPDLDPNRQGQQIDTSGIPLIPTNANDEPPNRPDSLTSDKHFIFVHGYSVNQANGRAWGSDIFKRLYQSGMNAKYTVVVWCGNQGEGNVPKAPPPYWVNVTNAFTTAPALQRAVDALQGTKVIAAHSLGNVVVSSAIVDYHMTVAKYFMLDAAVPSEAYDINMLSKDSQQRMMNPYWKQGYLFSKSNEYPTTLWASYWYQLFPNDARKNLTWQGRFASLSNAVNYYSSGEDVLAPAAALDAGGTNWKSWPNILTVSKKNAWVYQEMGKGQVPNTAMAVLQPLEHGLIVNEGGWGFNRALFRNGPAEAGTKGNKSAVRDPNNANYSPDSLKTQPFFLPFVRNPELMDPAQGPAKASDPWVRANALAGAIPALSDAAGGTEVAVFQDNQIDLMTLRSQSQSGFYWPDSRMANPVQVDHWLHSDAKNVAFFFNHALFADWINRGNLQ